MHTDDDQCYRSENLHDGDGSGRDDDSNAQWKGG
jgi:hypothetical protein